jgi:hypothetical protein
VREGELRCSRGGSAYETGIGHDSYSSGISVATWVEETRELLGLGGRIAVEG